MKASSLFRAKLAFFVGCLFYLICFIEEIRQLNPDLGVSGIKVEHQLRKSLEARRDVDESTRIVVRDQDRLRTEADKILSSAAGNITCDYEHVVGSGGGDRQIFYNRIGKAGSTTLSQLFESTVDKRNGVKVFSSLFPSGRFSDEFMTRQGELELIQKIVGSPQLQWMGSSSRSVFIYHAFFLNFTRYNLSTPIYINLMRDPGKRYASQYAYWKTLPDIGKLETDHGATMEVCLTGQFMGCPPLNYQTSYFCGHEPACHDPPTDASFLQAAKHVVENYAVVGTLERLDDFKEQCAIMFPEWIADNKMHRWRQHPDERNAANANKHNKVRSEKELTAIREANLYDVLLYELVEKISDKRIAACRKKRTEKSPTVAKTL